MEGKTSRKNMISRRVAQLKDTVKIDTQRIRFQFYSSPIETLSVATYNKRILEGKVSKVRRILGKLRYPYNRRIAGSHGNFTLEDWKRWLRTAGVEDLAAALTRLAQLNQVKVYLFWEKLTESHNGR